MHTLKVPELIGAEIRVPVSGMPSLAEVMVLLCHVELRSRLFRLNSLFKVREGAFDPTIRKFTITDAGIVVGEAFEGVEAILSGMAREDARVATAARQPEDRDRGTPDNRGVQGEGRDNGADSRGRVCHCGPAGDGAHRRGLPRAARRQWAADAGRRCQVGRSWAGMAAS
jgi:hypothetical protein